MDAYFLLHPSLHGWQKIITDYIKMMVKNDAPSNDYYAVTSRND